MRAKLPDVTRDLANHVVQIEPMQLAIGVIENDCTRNFQDIARGGELLATQGGQFLIVFRHAAVTAGLSRRQAQH
jgi:hypothetical protein